eukprot:Protomagalhaensia_sp_Gyna_25__5588@NODE_76_length_5570_cov_17_836738_g57_i0_p3_GENE_NODE_76_length_5570_cov_17_836738_g57_i0NODE_76_length_5570_cov_17_836738_g57_i0_p3_ORF_typecomplete_len216_score24_34SNARE_assoc/PF09335_11/1_2e06SNARE_assoc/PF09335_11/1_3e03_NODE_76_length_5570_cov_17_836738_g57_i029453592
MLKLIQNYGGLSVFLLSCWPNALFDLCGILCGQFLMPFWEFFVPLVLGKAVVKVLLQTSAMIYLFSKVFDASRAKLIAYVVEIPPFSHIVAYRFGSSADFENWLIGQIRKLRRGSAKTQGSHTWVDYIRPSALFSYAVYAVVIAFVIGLIEEAARSQQKIADDAEWQSTWGCRLGDPVVASAPASEDLNTQTIAETRQKHEFLISSAPNIVSTTS